MSEKINVSGKIKKIKFHEILKRNAQFYRYFLTFDSNITVVIDTMKILNIKLEDKMEVTGFFESDLIMVEEIKFIQKYIPPQRKIEDFVK